MLPCHWHEDRNGERILIPGCASRAQDPDGEECTCPTLAQQLEAVRAELAQLKKELAGVRDWHTHVTCAVYAHREGRAIMRDAADRANVDDARRKETRLPSVRTE